MKLHTVTTSFLEMHLLILDRPLELIILLNSMQIMNPAKIEWFILVLADSQKSAEWLDYLHCSLPVIAGLVIEVASLPPALVRQINLRAV